MKELYGNQSSKIFLILDVHKNPIGGVAQIWSELENFWTRNDQILELYYLFEIF